MSLFVLGSTGLVGGFVVQAALKSKDWTKITTLTRRQPQFASDEAESRLNPIIEADTAKWTDIIKEVKPVPYAYISSFGTTRAAAGSAENFKTIDYGINYNAAKSAKESGVKTLVLVSAIGANANSPFLYLQTKGKLEDDIIALDFDHTIILRPGQLLGDRKNGKRNELPQKAADFLLNVPGIAWLMKAVNASDVGKIAVHFAEQAQKGELKEKVKIVGGGELLSLAGKL
ncbi:FMP52 [Candida metapsilosis]|uniref:FMP52 n=1 Tax=Candida metapsilosis TaxID=273372 RepID=A0A8H8DBJ2_9ASCO|nr:FMP52 [Candida metapsilosis]